MIIKIDNSIHNFSSQEVNNDFLSFIEDLCLARKLGNIVIHASKKTLLTIISRTEISTLQRAIIKYANEQVTFKQELFENIKLRMVIYHSDYEFNKESHPNNFILIDLKGYYTNYTEKGINPFTLPKLVLEDISDRDIYMKICEWYQSKMPFISQQKIALDIRHGGGDRTAIVCKELLDSGNNVFCICDSDSKYYGDDVRHETAKKVSAIFSEKGKSSNLYVLNCQEVENLIPPSIYEATANATQLPAINFIQHINTINPASYLYMDIKNGFKYDTIFGHIPNEYSNYWKPFFLDFNCNTYITIKNKIENNELPSTATIICKLSSLIPYAVERLKIAVEFELQQPMKEEWESIAFSIFSWGCGAIPIKM